MRIAFCGNGFIHLNIAEIHEEDIGGQKKCAPIGKLSSKWAILVPSVEIMLKIIKKSISRFGDNLIPFTLPQLVRRNRFSRIFFSHLVFACLNRFRPLDGFQQSLLLE